MIYGYIAAIVAAILWSISPVLIKLYAEQAHPIAFNGFRTLSALIAFLAISPLLDVADTMLPLGKDCLYAFIIAFLASVIGPGIGDVMYIRAIQLLGSSRAVMIGYTYIFVAQGLAVLLLKEKANVMVFVGSILAVFGLYLAMSDTYSEYTERMSKFLGIVYASISSIAWGIGSIVNKLALGFWTPLGLTFIRLCIVTPILLALGYRALAGIARDRRSAATAAITGILSYCIGIPLFLISIKYVGVSIAVIATALTPLIATLLSRFIAHEKLYLRHVIGAVFTSLGIGVVAFGIPV